MSFLICFDVQRLQHLCSHLKCLNAYDGSRKCVSLNKEPEHYWHLIQCLNNLSSMECTKLPHHLQQVLSVHPPVVTNQLEMHKAANDSVVAIPVCVESECLRKLLVTDPELASISTILHPVYLPSISKLSRSNFHIVTFMARFKNVCESSESMNLLLRTLPLKWERYSDFILFPSTAFDSSSWIEFFSTSCTREAFFRELALCMGAKWIARKHRIASTDTLRRPNVDWLHCEFAQKTPMTIQSSTYWNSPLDNPESVFWCKTKQNSLWYVWSPTHSMFSAGNITEKTRILHSPLFKAPNGVVVDLYAGVGYFSLPYAHASGAKLLHACELNGWTVEGMKRALTANNLPFMDGSDFQISKDAQSAAAVQQNTDATSPCLVVIHEGNNENAMAKFESTASQVNLGLLPSSEQGWPLAVRALCSHGGFLHIHVNLKIGEEEKWTRNMLLKLTCLFQQWKGGTHDDICWSVTLVHLEKVKSFAPRIFHYVADVECRPVL